MTLTRFVVVSIGTEMPKSEYAVDGQGGLELDFGGCDELLESEL